MHSMNDFPIAATALTVLYALLCLAVIAIWAQPQRVRPWHARLRPALFAHDRVMAMRELWQDLTLSAGGLAAIAFTLGALATALGCVLLALIGLAARAVSDDILAMHAAKSEPTDRTP